MQLLQVANLLGQSEDKTKDMSQGLNHPKGPWELSNISFPHIQCLEASESSDGPWDMFQ